MRKFLKTTKGTSRRQSFFTQLEAEIAAHVGDRERALDALSRSVSSGLIDLLWLARCKVFDPLRGSIMFRTLLARVEERAKSIVDAYTAP